MLFEASSENRGQEASIRWFTSDIYDKFAPMERLFIWVSKRESAEQTKNREPSFT